MSIEIILYPGCASRDGLIAHLVELGYEKTAHLWNWPEGTRNFCWFKEDQNISFDGVEATVFPQASNTASIPDSWLLHTRTRASASTGDREFQNHTIRTARKKFGGWFHNDSLGKNKYIRPTPDERDAVARGIFLSYEFVSEQLSALRFALPDPNPDMERMLGTKLEPLSTLDPTRVLYNALVPFAVAAIEHFFSQSFKIMLRHDPRAQEKLTKQSKKIEIPDVCAIRDGTKTIEDVIAEWYSFQSIGSIHTAFNDWFGINFQALIRRRKKVGEKLPVLERRLADLIEFRHGIVHRFSLHRGLRKPDIGEMLDMTQVLIEVFVEEVEKRRGIPIRDR